MTHRLILPMFTWQWRYVSVIASRITKKQRSVLRSFCDGNPSVIVKFPSQRSRSAENIYMSCRHLRTPDIQISWTDLTKWYGINGSCNGPKTWDALTWQRWVGTRIVVPAMATMGHVPWASCQIRNIAVCACVGNVGNVFLSSGFKGNCLLATPACITARASHTCRDACRDPLTRSGGENVPGIPTHALPTILSIWQEAHFRIVAKSLQQRWRIRGIKPHESTLF